jgi:site-specific recombinase XerD
VSNKGRKFPAEHYQREEVLALLDACPDTAVGRRNRALITVLWRGGLRLGEALALRWYDIDQQRATIRVRHGKGDKARTTALPPSALVRLGAWRADWDARFREPTLAFCTLQGREIDQSYVRALLPRLAREAGIQRRIHAHGLRHTFAVDLLHRGVNVLQIQQLLGHSNLGTTSVYLASLSPEDALDAVRDQEW